MSRIGFFPEEIRAFSELYEQQFGIAPDSLKEAFNRMLQYFFEEFPPNAERNSTVFFIWVRRMNEKTWDKVFPGKRIKQLWRF